MPPRILTLDVRSVPTGDKVTTHLIPRPRFAGPLARPARQTANQRRLLPAGGQLHAQGGHYHLNEAAGCGDHELESGYRTRSAVGVSKTHLMAPDGCRYGIGVRSRFAFFSTQANVLGYGMPSMSFGLNPALRAPRRYSAGDSGPMTSTTSQVPTTNPEALRIRAIVPPILVVRRESPTSLSLRGSARCKGTGSEGRAREGIAELYREHSTPCLSTSPRQTISRGVQSAWAQAVPQSSPARTTLSRKRYPGGTE